MENSYESGFAFVLEGATARVFYERLLYFLLETIQIVR